jgi:hypothetical protein
MMAHNDYFLGVAALRRSKLSRNALADLSFLPFLGFLSVATSGLGGSDEVVLIMSSYVSLRLQCAQIKEQLQIFILYTIQRLPSIPSCGIFRRPIGNFCAAVAQW